MNVVTNAINNKFWDFETTVPMTWYRANELAKNPVDTKINRRTAKVYNGEDRSILKKNEKNWFFTDLIFPNSIGNLETAGQSIITSIDGYCPFTLWIDGEEIFAEEHVWHATGPIISRLPFTVTPGKIYKIVACFEPTEIPTDLKTVQGVGFHVENVHNMAAQVSYPALELLIADRLSKSEDEKALVEKAAGDIDLIALENNNWDAYFASVEKMEATLAPFHTRAKNLTVHLAGHTHIDMDWMWTWKDTEYCIRRDGYSIDKLLSERPDIKFGISQVPFYSTLQEKDPDVFVGIKDKIKSGQWECLASTWVEGDLNMADGESIVRHFLYAKEWTRENLGIESKTLWEPDTFGHPANMPQLAHLAEIDNYFHWRCNPGAHDNWPIRYWEGVDGTKILAISEPYGASLNPLGVTQNIVNYIEKGYEDILHIWGFGDHGGGLARRQLELLELYKDKPLIPKFAFTTMGEFYALAEQKYKDILPTNFGETYTLFDGCFTTHSSIKQENRYCEGALLRAESLTALANTPKKEELKNEWTKVLYNHFHDIFDGAAVHDSYLDATRRSFEALNTAKRVADEVITANTTTNGNKVTVFNPNGVKGDFVCTAKLPEGTTALKCLCGCSSEIAVQQHGESFVFIAAGVPALSKREYEIIKGTAGVAANIREDNNNFYVETSKAKVAVHKGSGVIGSYFDLESGRELVAYGVNRHLTHSDNTRRDMAMNLFQIVDEAHNDMSAWLINDTNKTTNLLSADYVKMTANGAVFTEFEVKHTFRSSNLVERIRVYNDFKRIDFSVDIDWQEIGNHEVGVPCLKVSFANKLSAARSYFDGPFFVPERAADGLEQPTQKYLGVKGDEGGFLLLNDAKYGCDVLGGRARITLLRTGYIPDPRSDAGQFNFNFAFMPIDTGFSVADMLSEGIAYNRPSMPILGDFALGNESLQISDKRIVCTSLKLAENSDKRVLRFFNASDAEVDAVVTYDLIESAQEVNLLERKAADLSVNDHTLHLDFGPYEVKTILF